MSQCLILVTTFLWRGAVLQKLVFVQLVRIFIAYYGTLRFIAVKEELAL
jgi:hypothetical protein